MRPSPIPAQILRESPAYERVQLSTPFEMRRLVFAEAADLTLDGQGRILIPPDLRRYAELEREALIVGVDASIEIWSPQRWAAVESSLDANGAEIAQRLASLL